MAPGTSEEAAKAQNTRTHGVNGLPRPENTPTRKDGRPSFPTGSDADLKKLLGVRVLPWKITSFIHAANKDSLSVSRVRGPCSVP